MPKYRIGIDVGGTFTHAVAINNADYTLVGQVKVPTTHRSKNGVADGIIQSLNELLNNCSISPTDVNFIAHSTTQATNALLEGDVATVGVIAIGDGVEGQRVKSETDFGIVPLDDKKNIKVLHRYIEKSSLRSESANIIKSLVRDGAQSIVVAEAFSVDDPSNEKYVIDTALSLDIPCVGTHEISGLYGLKMRARTAVVNASIMPKMLETANATQQCVIASGIKAPLMIMRSDGGVMGIEEMKKRPILTILSGPAAGIASALLYVKVSNGIFLEVGGTSTDVAVIKNGRAQVKTAVIGGNRLYLRTLDSRTVGVAGGSMPRIVDGKIVDVGPRSAHIAGLQYCAFADSNIVETQNVASPQQKNSPLQFILPMPSDPPGYFAIGEKHTVTTTCAANALGLVNPTDYAYGNRESALAGLDIVRANNHSPLSSSDIATSILKTATSKIIKVVNDLIKDYSLEKDCITLIGGGGGAAAIVPFTAKEMGLSHNIAENHAVISAIGAALAMISNTIERSIINATKEDILRVRKEAEDSVIKMGACQDTVEVTIEVDQQKNIVRACACGATELRKKDLLVKMLTEEERKTIAGPSFNIIGRSDWYDAWGSTVEEKKLFGLLKTKKNPMKLVSLEGVIRLSFSNAKVYEVDSSAVVESIKKILEENTVYGDGGEKIPHTYLVFNTKVLDLTGLISVSQIISVVETEARSFEHGKKALVILNLE